ncbi:MAG TPA: hypothetical protein VFZ31_09685, partial [Vicinamibacterales bacterium]
MSEPIDDSPAGTHPEDRLDSWKAISAYLKRDVTTVQRWEKREGMPVHRHVHDKLGSVYAFRTELDAWMRRRAPVAAAEVTAGTDAVPPRPATRSPLIVAAVAAIAALVIVAVVWWRGEARTDDPLANAQFQMVTDFDGTEQAAAISRDGKLVAFVSDRD